MSEPVMHEDDCPCDHLSCGFSCIHCVCSDEWIEEQEDDESEDG